MQTTITIIFELISRFIARFANLNKVEAKLGLPLSTYSVGRPHTQQRGTNLFVNVVNVTTSIVTPKLNGWSFIGTVDPTKEGCAFLMVPGIEIPEEVKGSDFNPQYCDHCRVSRRRNQTFLVRNDSGEVKQVGRSCLKDFTGHDSAAHIAELFTAIHELHGMDREESCGGHGEILFPIIYFLEMLCAWIRVFGYESKKAAEERGGFGTGANVWDFCCRPRTILGSNDEPIIVKIEEEDEERARILLAFGRAIEPTDDYTRNLHTYMCEESVSHRSKGFVASIYSFHQKATRPVKEKKTGGAFLGEEGDKINTSGTIEFAKEFDNDYGTTSLLKIETESGDTITWFASKSLRRLDVDSGDKVTIKGTIKALNNYNGRNETVLTRCKIAKI